MSADVTWQRNAGSQIVLDSIFAALAGVWVTIAIPISTPHMSVWFKIIEGSFSLASFFLFAISAEGSLTASDENDVVKYLYYLLWYNVGVVLLGVALTLFAFERVQHFITTTLKNSPGVEHFFGTSDLVIYLIVTVLLLWRWIHDAWFLRFANDSAFQNYVQELTDQRPPTPDHHCVMRCVFARRLRRNEEASHEDVFTRLKPSPIHGIGVFAIRRIPKGSCVFGADDAALVWVPKEQICQLSEPLKSLYDDFSVVRGERYGCPKSFNDLTVSWYLNHSENPNVAANDSFRFYALRDIEEGEELTVNYRTYSDPTE